MAHILIIDDEAYIRDVLSSRVERMGHIAHTAANLDQALPLLNRVGVDLVFLDVNLPDGSGLEALPLIKQSPSKPEVIIITAVGSSEGAELAIKNGAWDYIGKPFRKEEIILLIRQTLEYRAARMKQQNPLVLNTDAIVGKSPLMKACIAKVAHSASNTANVLIQGETGTGKELFAKAIHDNCPHTHENYIVVDCAAMPEALTESVLFGHKRGAFTGADTASEGLIKNADKGTLFLDEIGELPLSVQKAFLRVLQEKKFRPVGSSTEVVSNFRLISATNRDLEQMVDQGSFRRDLLHRLKTFTIDLPPLRLHKEDINCLALHYMDKLCEKHGIPKKAMLPDTLKVLNAHDWPGNVRELINAIEKAILSEPELPLLYPMFLPSRIRIAHANKYLRDKKALAQKDEGMGNPDLLVPTLPLESVFSPGESPGESLEHIPTLKNYRNNVLERVETVYLRYLMKETQQDLEAVAEIAGISKNRLYFLLRKYNLK